MEKDHGAKWHTTVTSHGVAGIVARDVQNSTVTMTTGPVAASTNLKSELRQLANARADGTIDEATYKAANDELENASSLETNETEAKHTALLSLKRLRGLVADVAEPATTIATIISAVNSLS